MRIFHGDDEAAIGWTRLGEAERLAALRNYQILDTEAELSFDRISRAAADVCGAPMALVSLVDEHRQWFKSKIGVAATETPRSISFCAHAIKQDGLLIVPDTSADPRFADNPLVTGPTGVRFYAGAPLHTPGGHRIGTLCVLDRKVRAKGLTAMQSRMMQTLSAQVVAELELRRTMARLEWLVCHDTLTGLPNRLMCQERLTEALAAATSRSNAYRVGVVMLDLDHFKQVNDVFGHAAGDALLKRVAAILAGFIRPGETAARLGGDEFILVLPDCHTNAALLQRMDDLLERLRQPYLFAGNLLDGRASIGIAIFPGHCRDVGGLLKHADTAMYRAKSAGRGSVSIYRHDFGADVERRVDALNAVHAAIRSGDIFPYYQPQISLLTGAIVGCEALVRLRDSAGKVHPPKEIEDAFEDRDLGIAIGASMLMHIVRDMRGWLAAGIDPGHVAINASAVELRRVDYAETMFKTLAQSGISPSRIHVEVTESVFVGRGSEKIEDTLRALSAGGIKIALDDFGTGFASLSHLKKFPVDIIKIDRSFIANLQQNSFDVAIVTAVIKLASNLGMQIIAEGVETARQANILRSIGCDIVQGYYFARALTADKYAAMSEAVTTAGMKRLITEDFQFDAGFANAH